MANQSISALPRTTVINGVDTELFPFDQTGNTVAITGTNLLAQLLNLINGHGGIASISSPVVSGRNKTYTITFDDETTTTFTVTDGNGIAAYEVEYAIGDDPSDPTSVAGSYSSTLPEATDENPFTWARLTLTDDDGVDTVIYSVGYKGKDGTAITESTISYGISSSPIVPPSSFSPSFVVTTTENPYQWTRIDTSYSDSALDTTAYCVAGTPFISVDSVTVTTLPDGSDATATVSNVISGAENGMSFAFGIPQGEKGETGDYIDPITSYGTSNSAVTEPSTWYNSPTSLDYSAGRFIWCKTDYTLSGAQTVQRTIKSIIGYIGANGSGSGTVTQVTFNGVANLDDGTGNVSITVEPDDVGAIANPTTKNNGQVLTYDSTAGEWVAANPSTGNVNTVNNVGVTAGTTDIALKGSDIPIDSTPSTGVAVITDANGKLAASSVTATELGYLSGVNSAIQSQISDISDDVDEIATDLSTAITYTSVTNYNNFKPTTTSVSRQYGYSTGDGGTNAPFTGDNTTFRGYVEGNANYCTQHLTVEYSATASNYGRTFMRVCLNGTWRDWQELVKKTRSDATFTVTYSGVSATWRVYRVEDICFLSVNIGNGTAFSSATGSDQIGNLPAGYYPSLLTHAMAIGRTDGVWTSALYYPVDITISDAGLINIRGEKNNLKTCKYITGSVCWRIA